MKPIRLNDDVSASDPELARALIEAIGADDFAARLLQACHHRLPCSHCTVFALQSSLRVEDVSSASAIGEVATLTAVEYLRQGFDQQDSNMRWLARRKPAARHQFWLAHQFAHEVADAHYRRICYGETGIRERLSLLSVFPDGGRVAVSLYRNHAYPDFVPADSAWLSAQGALIGAAVLRHVQLGRQPVGPARALQRIGAVLPARERELVSHVLNGLTTREAAEQMGVSLTTAATYRYRAFQHLGIRSHRELIALFGPGRTPPAR